jgi:hypothetical protein
MAAVLLALALPPAGALAVAPGDSVGFTIPDSAVGDSYAVFVEGTQVASGTDTTPARGFSGSYVMPNRGIYPRTIGVVVAVTGSTGTRYHAHTVDYALPVRPAPNPAPSAPAPRQKQPRPRADGGERQEEGAVLGTRSASKAERAAARRARKAKRRRARKRRRPKLNQVARRRDPPAVHGRDVAAPRDTRRDLSGDEFPGVGYSVAWQLLLAVALTGLLLVALIAARNRRRRLLAEEEAAMERELQELVAQVQERRSLRH